MALAQARTGAGPPAARGEPGDRLQRQLGGDLDQEVPFTGLDGVGDDPVRTGAQVVLDAGDHSRRHAGVEQPAERRVPRRVGHVQRRPGRQRAGEVLQQGSAALAGGGAVGGEDRGVGAGGDHVRVPAHHPEPLLAGSVLGRQVPPDRRLVAEPGEHLVRESVHEQVEVGEVERRYVHGSAQSLVGMCMTVPPSTANSSPWRTRTRRWRGTRRRPPPPPGQPVGRRDRDQVLGHLVGGGRADPSGVQRVDPDAVQRELHRRGLRQPGQSPLRGDVAVRPGRPAQPLDRGGVDDRPATGGDQGVGGGLHAQERAGQVHLEHLLPLRPLVALQLAPVEDAGVVDRRRCLSRPNSATVRATAPAQSSSEVTSRSTCRAASPRWSARLFPSSSRRSPTTTFAPSATSILALAPPMLRAPGGSGGPTMAGTITSVTAK